MPTSSTDDKRLNLRNLPSVRETWAPCLTWCEADGLFYLVYGIMESMIARYFDIDNFLATAADLQGPWSEPVYLHSAGFDASLPRAGRKEISRLAGVGTPGTRRKARFHLHCRI